MTNRRIFILNSVIGSGMFVSGIAMAAPILLSETDPMAKNLGYSQDTLKVDATKYMKHTKEQQCSNCALYQGKVGVKSGPCPLFAGKEVSSSGWCSAWAKKA